MRACFMLERERDKEGENIGTLNRERMRNRGAPKLTGENLKLVWAEFSTLSQAVLMMSIYLFT